ncbi:hypothetical protein EGW08_008782 [Elysia chlorotica]|uniref:Fibrinogen C-terminal domain-containing protein n=1 Tax=Elysia chlorotica TaxID=188477 RepID=A0A433TPP3_ELYCH|nr:hypothetical protein EGW08_008782 [Elysia chlorotica]
MAQALRACVLLCLIMLGEGARGHDTGTADLAAAISAQVAESVKQVLTQALADMEVKVGAAERRLGQTVLSFQEQLRERYDDIDQRLSTVQSFVGSMQNTSNTAARNSPSTGHIELGLASQNDTSFVTRSDLETLLAVSESRRSRDLKSMLSHFVVSNACEKGMLAFLTPTFPYPVTFPKNTLSFPFPCDGVTDGGGWIIIQRRAAGNTDFNRTWADYKHGFGSFDSDFWLGNDKIYTITRRGTYELLVEMRYNGTRAYAHYDRFSIADENHQEVEHSGYSRRTTSRSYKLSLGAYSGDAGDSLRESDGQAFSTRDRDRDASPGNCALEYGGGWWFVGCGYSCLNGRWGADSNKGVEWRELTGGRSVAFSEMKIRRVS